MKMLTVYIVMILPLVYYVFALDTWVSLFDFSRSDSLIVFQMLGFILLVPKITRYVTRLVVNHIFEEKYNNNDPSHYWMVDWVRAYAIVIIVLGYVFQTEASQYFIYDNNLVWR